MLKHLLKLEFKTTARIMLPIFVVLLSISVIERLMAFLPSDNDISEFAFALSTILYIFVLCAAVAAVYIVIIQRFYKALIKDEAYLTFTLPVKASNIILSKIITSTVWVISTLIVVLVSYMILLYNMPITDSTNFNFEYIGSLFSAMDSEQVTAVICTGCLIIVSAVGQLFDIFIAISIASLFRKHRVILSVAFYIAVEFVMEFISFIITSIAFLGMDTDYTLSAVAAADSDPFFMLTVISKNVFTYDAIFLVIICIVEFFVMRYIFSKHVNVD